MSNTCFLNLPDDCIGIIFGYLRLGYSWNSLLPPIDDYQLGACNHRLSVLYLKSHVTLRAQGQPHACFDGIRKRARRKRPHPLSCPYPFCIEKCKRYIQIRSPFCTTLDLPEVCPYEKMVLTRNYLFELLQIVCFCCPKLKEFSVWDVELANVRYHWLFYKLNYLN